MISGLQKQLGEVQALLQRNQLPAARKLAEMLALAPQAGRDAWYWVAIARARMGEHPLARTAIEKAISLSHPDANLQLTASNVCQDVGDLTAALTHARRCIEIDPRFAQGHNNIGILLADQKRFDESETAFRAAIKIKPDYARAYANLATTLTKKGRLDEARKIAEKCIAVDARYAHGHYALASATLQLGQHASAETALHQTLMLAPSFADAWMLLATLFRQQRRYQDAFAALGKLAALDASRVDALAMAGDCAWCLGDEQRAHVLWADAIQRKPTCIEAHLRAALSLPEIYTSSKDLETRRERFIHNLHQLKAKLPQLLQADAYDALREVQYANFYLGYQCQDDFAEQREYADFISTILENKLPQFFQPLTPTTRSGAREKIKVGFMSRFFYECTAGHYFESHVTALDRTHFEVHIFNPRPGGDALTDRIKARADHYFCGDELLEQFAERIRRADLDILIYPELAMEPKIFALAAMRLVPVQVAGWGHPVTPGHRNIDYFLTTDVMEPVDAPRHYHEALVPLPGIGTTYRNPARGPVSAKTRADLGISVDAHLYFMPQSLFKVLPENDALVAEVLVQDPKGIVLFFSTERAHNTQKFSARLGVAFARANLDMAIRTRFLGHLAHPDYKRANQLCDVMLDTLHWSGGNTSLDALAMGLPIVTLPGEFMRGRQTTGMLTLMGLEELIAKDKEDYVRIAVKLGTDKAYRQATSEKIIANHDKVFDDPKPIDALQDFLRGAVAKSRAKGGASL